MDLPLHLAVRVALVEVARARRRLLWLHLHGRSVGRRLVELAGSAFVLTPRGWRGKPGVGEASAGPPARSGDEGEPGLPSARKPTPAPPASVVSAERAPAAATCSSSQQSSRSVGGGLSLRRRIGPALMAVLARSRRRTARGSACRRCAVELSASAVSHPLRPRRCVHPNLRPPSG